MNPASNQSPSFPTPASPGLAAIGQGHAIPGSLGTASSGTAQEPAEIPSQFNDWLMSQVQNSPMAQAQRQQQQQMAMQAAYNQMMLQAQQQMMPTYPGVYAQAPVYPQQLPMQGAAGYPAMQPNPLAQMPQSPAPVGQAGQGQPSAQVTLPPGFGEWIAQQIASGPYAAYFRAAGQATPTAPQGGGQGSPAVTSVTHPLTGTLQSAAPQSLPSMAESLPTASATVPAPAHVSSAPTPLPQPLPPAPISAPATPQPAAVPNAAPPIAHPSAANDFELTVDHSNERTMTSTSDPPNLPAAPVVGATPIRRRLLLVGSGPPVNNSNPNDSIPPSIIGPAKREELLRPPIIT